MRNTVLLLLLVALASAAPVAEDADEKNILQMLQNADPNENDIFDSNALDLPKSNEYERESQEEVSSDIIPTTEYVLESKSKIDSESSQETVTESETEAEINLDLKPVVEVETVPEEPSNNATKLDFIVEAEPQLEANVDTEIVNEANDSIDVEATQVEADLGPWVIESPKYSIKSPWVVPELDTTDLDEITTEDGIYTNQEWPQRYAPDFPVIPNTQEMEQVIFNMEDTPQIPGNTFGDQVFPEGYIPEIYDSGAVGPMGPPYQVYNEQPARQFIDIVPLVDAWSNTYPNTDTFNSNPEVNYFGEDGMAHEMIKDITLEPIYYGQMPKFYDDTPESSLNEELPLAMIEEPEVMDDSNESLEDRMELLVINEDISETPFTPIAEEVEQPQDSPIIPTAILQDTRPDVDLLGLFGDSGDAIVIEETPYPLVEEDFAQPQDSPIIPTAILQDTRPEVDLLGLFDDSGDAILIEEIEETPYPLVEEDFVEENLPASEGLPNGTFDQDDVIIDNSNFPSADGEIVLNPFGMMPPLIRDFEQAIDPNMPNNQRIYFDNEVRENLHIFPQTFQSNPDFMVPQVQDQFPFGNENYQPHGHNGNIDYHGDFPHNHYNDDIPHTHNEHQFDFDNAPHNNYFEDSASRKRDGAQLVPGMDNMKLPIMDMGEMEIFNSPMMGPTNPGATPQITVILVSKPEEAKRIWSQLIRSMQQKPFSPVDISQSQGNLKDLDEVSQTQHRFINEIQGNGPYPFGNMGQFPQIPNMNQFNQKFDQFNRNFDQFNQNFDEQPMQNYNAYQNMNSPPNQMFNSGMSPFTPNFNQQQNMGDMLPNLDMDSLLEDLEFIGLEDMERQNMFTSQQPSSPYGPPSMFSFSNQQQQWPNRYAPNFQEMNFGNNGQFYPQQRINRPFFIPS